MQITFETIRPRYAFHTNESGSRHARKGPKILSTGAGQRRSVLLSRDPNTFERVLLHHAGADRAGDRLCWPARHGRRTFREGAGGWPARSGRLRGIARRGRWDWSASTYSFAGGSQSATSPDRSQKRGGGSVRFVGRSGHSHAVLLGWVVVRHSPQRVLRWVRGGAWRARGDRWAPHAAF